MTRRIAALAITACFAVVATPALARHHHQKKNTQQISVDQHRVGSADAGPVTRAARSRSARRARGKPPRTAAFTSRDCLHTSAKHVLDRLEARFGRVALVKTCVPGARMPSGQVSWHAHNRAFDFNVPNGVDKRDVMVWLGRNSPGVTISYRSMPRTIHTDTGTFHKVIYSAANHQAGERAVAIWQAREAEGVQVAKREPPSQGKRKPQQQRREAPPARAETVTQLAAVEPANEEYQIQPPADRVPEPINWHDRKGILQRYFDSREVVVRSNVNLSCPGGKPLPKGLVALLKDSATHYGRTVYVNSFYRSPSHNRRVGGARNSQHVKCRAVDFRVAGVSPNELKRWVMANRARFGITGLGTYGTHTHADNGERKATKLVTWNGGHKRYAKRRHQRYAAAG